MNVRIYGEMNRPLGGGPSNGMYALQKALIAKQRAGQADWLEIGGEPHDDELVWFWNWQNVDELLRRDSLGLPCVAGPNILFELSWRPCRSKGEKEILDSPHCRLLFTESDWYARLIEAHRGPRSTAPLVLWPYPIDPQPDRPIFPAKYDLLIYAKSGPGELHAELARRFPRTILVHYGHYRREEFWFLARQSRACVYLSDDDRGPLALAEALLCGCPAIGIEKGAPWIETGKTGVRVDVLTLAAIEEAAVQILDDGWDRHRVRCLALRQFDPDRIAGIVLAALDAARRDGRQGTLDRSYSGSSA